MLSKPISKVMALGIALSLSLPNSAFALRQTGLEESNPQIKRDLVTSLTSPSNNVPAASPTAFWVQAGLEEDSSMENLIKAGFPVKGLVQVHTRVPIPKTSYDDERLRRMEEKYDWNVDWKTRSVHSEGSGIIFHEDKKYFYILSAYHVVKPMGPSYSELGFLPSLKIVLSNGRKRSAEYLGSTVGVGGFGAPHVGLLRVRKVNVQPDFIQVIPLADPALVEAALRTGAEVIMAGYPGNEDRKQSFQLKVGKILPRGDPMYQPFLERQLKFPLVNREAPEEQTWVPEEYVAVRKDDLQGLGGISGGAVLYQGRIIGVLGFGQLHGHNMLSISATTVRVVLQALIDGTIPEHRFEDASDAVAKAAFAEALRQTATAGLEEKSPWKSIERAHAGWVVNLAPSRNPNIPKFVSAGADGLIRVWGWDSGAWIPIYVDNEPLKGLEHPGVLAIDLSSNGVAVLSVSPDRVMRENIHYGRAETGLPFNIVGVSSSDLGPGGVAIGPHRMSAAFAGKFSGQVYLQNLDDKRPLSAGRTLPTQDGSSPLSVGFRPEPQTDEERRGQPDGRILAVGTSSGNVELWKLPARIGEELPQRLLVLPGHAGNVLAIDFSLDGKLLATGDDRGVIRIWDVRNLEEKGVAQLRYEVKHQDAGRIFRLEFSSEGNILASAGEAGTVRFWNTGTGKQFTSPTFIGQIPVHSVIFKAKELDPKKNPNNDPLRQSVAIGLADGSIHLLSNAEFIAPRSVEELVTEMKVRRGFGFINRRAPDYPADANPGFLADFAGQLTKRGLTPKFDIQVGDEVSLDALRQFRKEYPAASAAVAIYEASQVASVIAAAKGYNLIVSARGAEIQADAKEVARAGATGRVLVIAKVEDWKGVQAANQEGVQGIEVEPAADSTGKVEGTVELLRRITAAKEFGRILILGSAGGVKQENAADLLVEGYVGFSVAPGTLESKLQWFKASMQTVPVLKSVLFDPSPDVRISAVEAIAKQGRLVSPEIVSLLRMSMWHHDPRVYDAISKVLERISPSAGLEEGVSVRTVQEIAEKAPGLAADLKERKVSGLALLPVRVAPAEIPKRLVHLYGHPAASEAAIQILPEAWGLGRWEIIPVGNPARANELLQKATEDAAQGWTAVIALNPSAGLILPQGHPLTLLISPEKKKWEGIKRDVLAAFVDQLRTEKNLILDLTSGSIRVLDIPGWGQFYAIDLLESA